MFYCCSSLTNVDLSNFNTQNIKDIGNMFYKCSSLKKEYIIANDKKIIDSF